MANRRAEIADSIINAGNYLLESRNLRGEMERNGFTATDVIKSNDPDIQALGILAWMLANNYLQFHEWMAEIDEWLNIPRKERAEW